MASLENIKYLLVVSCGGILGSNVRFLIFQWLDEFFIRKDLQTILINNLASFLLGFLSAILNNHSSLDYSFELGLLIIVGFLGGLSTFSTFMYDLFESSFNFKLSKIINIFLFSILSALMFLSIGILLGNQ